MSTMKILKTITIPGQLISKKNNLMAVKYGNFIKVTHKKAWKDYEKVALKFLKGIEPLETDTWPVYLHIYHYRKDRRAFDYVNLAQGILDIIQGDLTIKTIDLRHQIVPEDDMRHIIPVMESAFAGWEISKEMPRTVLTFTDEAY